MLPAMQATGAQRQTSVTHDMDEEALDEIRRYESVRAGEMEGADVE